MNSKIQSIIYELKLCLAAIYGERLAHLVVFGSQARGDAVTGSDIDVMVVLEDRVSPGKEIARVGTATSELSLKHDVVICCVFVSAERYKTEESPFLLNVRREGVAA